MTMISEDVVSRENDKRVADLKSDYAHLGAQLARRGVDIDAVKRKVAAYAVAVPSWGVGTGGTRFARFPGEGEPRNIFDKLDASRVEQIIKLVAGDNFGQIFITDTNHEHLDKILKKMGSDYKMFEVNNGNISSKENLDNEKE